MRFGRRNSDPIPEMVSLNESDPTYRDSPRPQYPQELPGGYMGYADGSSATAKSHFLASERNSSIYHDQQPRKRRRICGVSPLFFAIGLVAVLLIIAGAVVGGVLGTRSTQNKNVSPSSSNASQLPAGSASSSTNNVGMTVTTTAYSTISATASLSTSTSSSTSTTKQTSSTVAASIRPTSTARFAGIAAANAGNGNIKLFYIDKQKNGIVGYSHRSSLGWENHGVLTGLNYPPSMSNSIALSYWVNSNGEGIRLYYISQTSSLIELVLTCPSQAACSVNGQTVLPPIDIGDTSNLSVVQYWNSANKFRAWVYYINKSNQVARTSYLSGWSSAASMSYTVYPGSSLATTMVYADLLGHKTYYMRSDGTLSSIYEYDDGRTPYEAIIVNPNTVSAVDNSAYIAACDIPSSANGTTYHEGRIFRIATDSYPYQEYSRNSSAWTSDHTASNLGKADFGSKDGLAATSWYNSSAQQDHVRIYYPSGGAVQEYGIDNWSGWYGGNTFPNT